MAGKTLSTKQAAKKIERSGSGTGAPRNPSPNTQGESGNVEYPMPTSDSQPQRPTHTPGS